MQTNKVSPLKLAALVLASALIWVSSSALAQGGSAPSINIRILCEGQVALDWGDGSRQPNIIYFDRVVGENLVSGEGNPPGESTYKLKKNAGYELYVYWGDGRSEKRRFSTRGDACEPFVPRGKPPDVTCPLLPPSIVISGYGQFTQCKQVDEAGVGIAELIAQGIVDAVDVYGTVDANARICFRNQGRLKFLDAATAPRTISDLAAETIDGMTCGTIDRPGMLVLLQGSETSADAESTAPISTGPAAVQSCQLVSTGYLSLRAGPSVYYARIEAIPSGARLLGTAKAGDWFLVKYKGQLGWSSGTYLTASPGCAAIGESNRVFLPLATEPTPVETEAQEEMIEPAQAETTAPGAQALTHCNLRTGDIINHRQGPGLGHDIIAEIPYQTNLIAAERSGDWFKVEYNGRMGWVNIDYVFRNGNCA